jgi:hypothetical protein
MRNRNQEPRSAAILAAGSRGILPGEGTGGRDAARTRTLEACVTIAFLIAVLGVSAAPMLPFGPYPVQSSSGQFVVFAQRSLIPSPRVSGLSSNTNYISLEPALLVVSCERIRQKLWDQLGGASSWRGKIHLHLHPATSGDDLVTIVAERFSGGWDYSVSLPDVLPRDRFVRAMVQVVLSEIGNRNGGPRAAEIPSWLVEGLCGKLRAMSEVELFLPPPTLNVRGLTIRPQVVNARWSNPGEQIHKEFRAGPPLTFDQLSWLAEGQLAGEAGEVYDRSALLFVDSLLRFPDGPACLRRMLENLPRHYNWQTAFLQAFQAHFQTPLEVEKWWALQVVHYTGRGLFDRWTPGESLVKLDETLRSRIEVRDAADALPAHSEAGLQTVIREWDLARQAQTLQRKLEDLDLLRLRVAPDLASLVEDYRIGIRTYLQRRGLSQPPGGRRLGGPVADRISQETLNQFDALDSRRKALIQPSAGSASP